MPVPVARCACLLAAPPVLVGACQSEPPTAPVAAKGGSSAPLAVTPSTLLLRSPGASKTFTATVQYGGLLTASSSDPACATPNPPVTASPEKPPGSSLYVAQFTVTGVGMGGCVVTVTDKKGNTASVRVSVSPITFASGRNGGGNGDIWLMDADGQNPVQLTTTKPSTNHPASESDPAWSPDGEKIAFWSTRDGENAQLYVMDADGQNQTRLSHNAAYESGPAWSPDGTRIAFHSNLDGGLAIYVMDADGQNRTRLTFNTADDASPSWSPDGTRIAFMSRRNDPNAGGEEIYVMDADGQNQTRLTTNTAIDVDPAWSPDGTKLAFSTERDGGFEIYVMDADGQNPVRLTNNSLSDFSPSWSPDGTRIAMDRRSPDTFDVWTMAPDGQDQTRLTDDTGVADNDKPAWR